MYEKRGSPPRIVDEGRQKVRWNHNQSHSRSGHALHDKQELYPHPPSSDDECRRSTEGCQTSWHFVLEHCQIDARRGKSQGPARKEQGNGSSKSAPSFQRRRDVVAIVARASGAGCMTAKRLRKSQNTKQHWRYPAEVEFCLINMHKIAG